MKNFLIRLVVNAIALWVAAALISGIHLADDSSSNSDKVTAILLVALVFGVINALLKPLATLLSLPAIVITLGLFMVVVNAAMLQLTSWFAGKLDLPFHVDHFWWDAVLGAIVISIVGIAANVLLPDRHEINR